MVLVHRFFFVLNIAGTELIHANFLHFFLEIHWFGQSQIRMLTKQVRF
jgi:hypothetical protein